jgi:hypothetical protein
MADEYFFINSHLDPYGTFALNMQERIPLEQAATLTNFGPLRG